MVRLTMAALLCAALVLAACGGDDDGGNEADAGAGSPEDALRIYIDRLNKDQLGRIYDEHVHPAQKAIVSRDQYMTCGGVDFQIEDVEIIETYEEPVSIPGTDLGEVESTAVTFSYTVNIGDMERENTQTVHLVEVDGAWRSIIEDPEAMANGECP